MTTYFHEQRLGAVLAAVRESGARSVLDLGCGDGDFLMRLLSEPRIERIVGLDISPVSLDRLRARLGDLPQEARERVELVQGSMIEPHAGLRGFDAAVLLETIEHVAPDRLSALEHAVFRFLRPPTVLITTPNADFNRLLGVPRHRFRHPEHRFEWGRERFRCWADGVARRNVYSAFCSDLGGAHPLLGGASQMARFERQAWPSP